MCVPVGKGSLCPKSYLLSDTQALHFAGHLFPHTYTDAALTHLCIRVHTHTRSRWSCRCTFHSHMVYSCSRRCLSRNSHLRSQSRHDNCVIMYSLSYYARVFMCVHALPVVPLGQVQVYEFSRSWQVPPFRHGWLKHSFMLVSHRRPVYPGRQSQVKEVTPSLHTP